MALIGPRSEPPVDGPASTAGDGPIPLRAGSTLLAVATAVRKFTTATSWLTPWLWLTANGWPTRIPLLNITCVEASQPEIVVPLGSVWAFCWTRRSVVDREQS